MRLPFKLSVPQLALAGLGFVPITCLSMSFFNLCPLASSAKYVLLPTFLAVLLIGFRYKELGYRALAGLVAGVIATAAYDTLRLTLLEFGVFRSDFIPNIGRLALEDGNASMFWGYLWRFICNGGFMGMAMGVLPLRGAWQGAIYGTFICCCLFATLILGPTAQKYLFELNWVSGLGAMAGHWVYGAVLGGVLQLWMPSGQKVDSIQKVFVIKPIRAAAPSAHVAQKAKAR